MPTAAETRHLLIDIARRRQRAGTGSSTEFLRGRTTQLRFPDLTATLAGIPWAATGAAAARMYMPERMTNDLDILIRKQDSAKARRRLEQAHASFKGELSIGGTSWVLSDGFPLDVIESEEEWIAPALQEAAANLDAHGMPVLPLPYQVMTKFRASRVQDLADITRMLGQASEEQLRAVRELFSIWLPKDLDDLESLVSLGRLEMQ
jgi:hypothetical protein